MPAHVKAFRLANLTTSLKVVDIPGHAQTVSALGVHWTSLGRNIGIFAKRSAVTEQELQACFWDLESSANDLGVQKQGAKWVCIVAVPTRRRDSHSKNRQG